MKRGARSALAATLVLGLLVVATAGPAAAREIKKDYHETFRVAEGHRLQLRHGDGDVTIEPWNRDEVDVEVHYRARVTKIGLGKIGDFEVEFDQSGKTLRIVGKEESSYAVGFLSHNEYEYTYAIKAPPYLELGLDGDDGEVSIHGWRAPVTCDLDDGDLVLTDVQAPRAEISLEDGDARIEELAGDLDLEFDDGEIQIRDCRFGVCRVEGEDGDVTIDACEGDFELSLEDGEIQMRRALAGALEIDVADGDVDLGLRSSDELDARVETEDGDVEVSLEPRASVRFELETGDGRLRVRLPDAELDDDEDEHISGRQHGGRGRLNIRTDDGDVRLREAR
jgi:DUF4097 and DUF4098 domain-containing protein YvlB